MLKIKKFDIAPNLQVLAESLSGQGKHVRAIDLFSMGEVFLTFVFMDNDRLSEVIKK